MTSIMLGTSASEGIPSAFCDCENCRKARAAKGKNIRTRTDFLIDEKNIIDFGPDIYAQVLREDIDLVNLENVFLTHFHDDHISLSNLMTHNSGKSVCNKPLNIYGSKEALEGIRWIFPIYKDHTHADAPDYFTHFNLMPLDPFVTYSIGGLAVTPILSSHFGFATNELGFNYIIQKGNGKKFLYAVDTGWYNAETWNFLRQFDIKLDFIVIECTYCTCKLPYHQDGHLDFENLLLMIDEFNKCAVIKKGTPIYVTHISHLNELSHEETQKYFDSLPWNLKMGYDGMKID